MCAQFIFDGLKLGIERIKMAFLANSARPKMDFIRLIFFFSWIFCFANTYSYAKSLDFELGKIKNIQVVFDTNLPKNIENKLFDFLNKKINELTYSTGLSISSSFSNFDTKQIENMRITFWVEEKCNQGESLCAYAAFPTSRWNGKWKILDHCNDVILVQKVNSNEDIENLSSHYVFLLKNCALDGIDNVRKVINQIKNKK